MSSNTENQRVNFASIKNPMKYPDFLEVQLKSFQDFLQLDTPPEKRKNDGLGYPTVKSLGMTSIALPRNPDTFIGFLMEAKLTL